MAVFQGYYEVDASADPQTVATALEAEPNIASAEVLGSVGESFGGTPSAGRVEILLTSIATPATTAWAAEVGEAGFDDVELDLTYDQETGTIPALPFTFIIGTERIKATADSGTVLTIVRGFDGTTAAAHSADAACVYDGDVGDLALAAIAAGAKASSGRPAAA